MTNIEEVTDELIVDVHRVVESLGKLNNIEEGDNSSLEQEEYFEQQQAATTRLSPTIKGKNTGRSASLPSSTTMA